MNNKEIELTSATGDSDTSADEGIHPRQHPKEQPSMNSQTDGCFVKNTLEKMSRISLGSFTEWESLDSDSGIVLKRLHEYNENLDQKMRAQEEANYENGAQIEIIDCNSGAVKERIRVLVQKYSDKISEFRALFSEKEKILREEMALSSQTVKKFISLKEDVLGAVRERKKSYYNYNSECKKSLKELRFGKNTIGPEVIQSITNAINEFEKLSNKLKGTEKSFSDSHRKYREVRQAVMEMQPGLDGRITALEVKQKKVDELKNQNKVYSLEEQKLREILKANADKSTSSKQAWHDKINKINNDINQLKKEKISLENEFEEGREIYEKTKKTSENLALETDRVLETNEELSKEIETAKKQNDDLVALTASLEFELDLAMKKRSRLEEMAEELLKQKSSNETLKTTNVDLENRLSQSLELGDRARDSLTATENKLKEEVTQFESATVELRQLSVKQGQINADINSCQNLLREKTEELERLIEKNNVKFHEISAQLVALSGAVSDAERKIDETLKSSENLTEELIKLNEENVSFANMIEEKRGLVAKIDEEKNELSRYKTELEIRAPKVSLKELDGQVKLLDEERVKIFADFEKELEFVMTTLKTKQELFEESTAKSMKEVKAKIAEKQRTLDKVVVKGVPRLTVERQEAMRQLRQRNESLVVDVEHVLETLKMVLQGYSSIHSYKKSGGEVSAEFLSRLENTLHDRVESMSKWDAIRSSTTNFVAYDPQTYLKIYESFKNGFDSTILGRNDIDPEVFFRKIIPLIKVFTKLENDGNALAENNVSLASDSQRSTQEDF